MSTKSASEKGLTDVGLTELSDLMLYTRSGYMVSDPALIESGYHAFFGVAHQVNLPLLFLACEVIRRLHPNQWIGFLGRDCFLLEQIYRHYFSFTCAYIPFSRVVAVRDRDLAVDYLNSFGCDVLVDITSTGATWEHLAVKQPFNVRVLIYADVHGYTPIKPVIPQGFGWVATNSLIGPTSEVIELFNCADQGSVLNLSPMEFGQNEIPDTIIRALHDPVSRAIAVASKFPNLTAQLAAVSNEKLSTYFVNYLLTLNDQKAIVNFVPGYREKNLAVTGHLKNIFGEIKKIPSKNDVIFYSSD